MSSPERSETVGLEFHRFRLEVTDPVAEASAVYTLQAVDQTHAEKQAEVLFLGLEDISAAVSERLQVKLV